MRPQSVVLETFWATWETNKAFPSGLGRTQVVPLGLHSRHCLEPGKAAEKWASKVSSP